MAEIANAVICYHSADVRCLIAQVTYCPPDRPYAVGWAPCCGVTVTTAGIPDRPRCMDHGKTLTEWDVVVPELGCG